MDELLNKTSALLKHSNGIVYGENHLSPNAGQWVRSNIENLKELGLTTIFLEIKRDQQNMLDDFATGKITEHDMRDSISQLNAEATENIIIEAKRLGLQVIAVDLKDPTPYLDSNNKPTWKRFDFDSIAGEHQKDEYDLDRLEYSNPAWADKVTKTMSEQPDSAKYLMLVGSDHTNLTDDPRYRGVDKILGIPSIDIYSEEDVKRNNSPYITTIFNNAIIDPSITQSNTPVVLDHPKKDEGTFAAFVPKQIVP